MTIFRGRKIKVQGEPFTWRLSDRGGRVQGTSGKEATFTAQYAIAHGALLRVRLYSRKWTERHDTDDDLQAEHRCAFTPSEAAKLIEHAIALGWPYKGKGAEFRVVGDRSDQSLTDYTF